MKDNNFPENKNNRKFATLAGGGIGLVASISLAALGCAFYGLPWDVMIVFAALYGGLSGSALGFLLSTFLADV